MELQKIEKEIKNYLKFLGKHIEKINTHLTQIHFDIQGELPKEDISEIDKHLVDGIFELEKIIDYCQDQTS